MGYQSRLGATCPPVEIKILPVEPKKTDDYLIDVVAAAHRHKVSNWGHEGRSGTFGQIGFIVQPGGPMWRAPSPRSTAKFWFLAANGSEAREIGTVDVRFTSPKGRLIARVVELGKAEIVR